MAGPIESFKTMHSMKLLLLLAGITAGQVSGLNAQTRTDVQLYAYVRSVSGGMAPRISTHENNLQTVETRHAKFTYLIYLEGPDKTRIYPVEMYIRGERTGVRFTVKKSPVEIQTGDTPAPSKTITLVPKTLNRVYQLDPAPLTMGTKINFKQTQVLSNELVVVYKYAGKFYYAVQEKFTVLEPVVLQ